jgi:hypothetical protein
MVRVVRVLLPTLHTNPTCQKVVLNTSKVVRSCVASAYIFGTIGHS